LLAPNQPPIAAPLLVNPIISWLKNISIHASEESLQEEGLFSLLYMKDPAAPISWQPDLEFASFYFSDQLI